MLRPLTNVPRWPAPLLGLAGALLLGPAACGKDDPLKEPDKAAAYCQRLQERNTRCWKQMAGKFRTMLLIQGINRIKVAPKEQRKQLLAEHKQTLETRLGAIRTTLVDEFVTHCKKDWQSPKPAHRQLKQRMLGCLAKPDCKAYAECFALLRGK